MFHILVVEDNADMRELFCTVLSDSGYRCVPAADGLEAFRVIEQEYIDLIVSDVMMPNMDGFELTKALRVEALLRRAKIASEKKIVVGSTVLNYDALTVTIHGQETVLPQKEFYLLYKLLSYPNKIFTRPQLMDEIWGMFSETDERTVNTHINRLRDRFEDCGDFEIVTVRGLGYKAVKKVE